MEKFVPKSMHLFTSADDAEVLIAGEVDGKPRNVTIRSSALVEQFMAAGEERRLDLEVVDDMREEAEAHAVAVTEEIEAEFVATSKAIEEQAFTIAVAVFDTLQGESVNGSESEV